MQRKILLSLFVTSLLAVAACEDEKSSESLTSCGPGTKLVGTECLVDGAENNNTNNVNNNTNNNNNNNNNTEPSVDCGPGTSLNDEGKCVPDEQIACGAGTELNDEGECVPSQVFECGEGTVDDGAGNCVPSEDPVVCADGTELQDGECVPAEDLCGADEAWIGGGCVELATLCGEGTIYVDGECALIDPLDGVDPLDNENNDPLFTGTAEELVLGGAGETKVFWGNIGPAEDLDGDEAALEPDFDVYVFEGQAGQRVQVQVTAVGVPSASFALSYLPGEGQADPQYLRVAVPFESANAVREVVLPWTGRYELRIGETNNLLALYGVSQPLGDWIGGEDFTWTAGVTVLDEVAPTEFVNGGFDFEGDLSEIPQALVNLPRGSILNLGVETNSPNAGAVLVTSTSDYGDVQQTNGGLVVVPEGGLLVTVDHVVNATADKGFTLRSIPVANTGLGELVAGAPLMGTGTAVSNNYIFYNFTVTAPTVVTVDATPDEGSEANLAVLLTDGQLQAFAGSSDDIFGTFSAAEDFQAFVQPGYYILAVGHEDFIDTEPFSAPFSFTVSASPVADLGALASQQSGTFRADGLGVEGGAAWVTASPSTLGLATVGATPDAGLDVSAELFTGPFLSARGQSLAARTLDDGGAGGAEQLQQVVTPGAVLVRATNVGGATDPTSLGADITVSLVNNHPVAGDEEVNNDVASATDLGPLLLNDPKFGQGVLGINEGSTADFFTFQITQGAANVRIESFGLGDAAATYARISVFEPNDLLNPVATAGTGGFPPFFPGEFGVLDFGLADGDYVLVVDTEFGEAEGAYAFFAVVEEEYECVPDSGALCVGDDVEICNEAGELEVVTCAQSCANYGTTSDCSGAVGAEPNESQDAAQDLGAFSEGRVAADGELLTADGNRDFDWYNLTVDNFGALATIQTLPRYGTTDATDTFLEIYNEAGDLVASNDDAGVGLFSLVADLSLVPGDYGILVRGFGANTQGGYRLQIDLTPYTCQPGLTSCDGANVVTCDGFNQNTTITCDTSCVADVDGARCEDGCVPNTARCDGDNLVACDDTGFESTLPCDYGCIADGGNAQCDTLCEPGVTRCDGDTLVSCTLDGSAEIGILCDFGCADNGNGAACELLCEPNAARCDGDNVVFCAIDGLSETTLACADGCDVDTNDCATLAAGEPNETQAEAQDLGTLPNGLSYVVGAIDSTEDTRDFDWYSFTVDGVFGAAATIGTFPENGSTTDTVIEVYDSVGAQIAMDDDGNAPFSLLQGLLLQPGTYGVLVRGFSATTTGEYRLAINLQDLTCEFQTSVCAGDDVQTCDGFGFVTTQTCVDGCVEENGSARCNSLGDLPITIPSSTDASLVLETEVDWYSFELTEATQLRIVSAGVDTQTWVCDSTDPFACSYDANYLTRADGFSSDIITYLFAVPGTYYVGVRGYQGEVGDYNLSVSEVNEPNNTPEQATSLAGTVTGRLPTGDADWYSVEVAADEVGTGLRFTTSFPAAPEFANLAAADTQLFLCAEADVANCTFESGNLSAADVVGDFESLELVFDAAGVYFLGVIAPNGGGFYALTVASFNPGDVGEPGNDTADGALPLAVPGSAQGIIGAANDVDRFLISITAPGSVTFVTSAGADPEIGDTQIALCDLLTPNCVYGGGAGVLVQNDDRDAGGGDYYSEVSYDFTEVGDYILVVRGYLSATGGYALTTSTP